MNDKTINNLIPSPEELLTYFNLSHLPEEQKDQIIQGMLDHFSELIIDTLTDNLSDQQAQTLEKAFTENTSEVQDKIQEIASRTPGLEAKIQMAIARELETLKAGFEQTGK